MSKTQKKFVQQDFPSQPLLSEKEIRHGFKYTDISAVEVTASILGKAKIRKIHPQDQMKLRWLALIIFLLFIAAAVWFTAHIEQKVDRLSTVTIESVVVPLSQSTVNLIPDEATTGRLSTTPAAAGSIQTNPAKIDTTKIDPATTNPEKINSEKINQVKTKQIEPDFAAKAGEVKISLTNADEVKKPSVLKPLIALPPNIEVHTPSAEAFQNEESVAPVEHLVDEPAPTFITQPDADSKEPSSE